jgi:hypothetical protein
MSEGVMREPAHVIEIPAPEVNEQDVIARIQKQLSQRQATAEAQGLDCERLVQGAEMRFSAGLYYDLFLARNRADDIEVPLSLVQSRVPLLGGLLTRIRFELHRLALHYVNTLAERQVVFNLASANTLSQLIGELEEREDLLVRLETEAASLRQRIDLLEQLLAARP